MSTRIHFIFIDDKFRRLYKLQDLNLMGWSQGGLLKLKSFFLRKSVCLLSLSHIQCFTYKFIFSNHKSIICSQRNGKLIT